MHTLKKKITTIIILTQFAIVGFFFLFRHRIDIIDDVFYPVCVNNTFYCDADIHHYPVSYSYATIMFFLSFKVCRTGSITS